MLCPPCFVRDRESQIVYSSNDPSCRGRRLSTDMTFKPSPIAAGSQAPPHRLLHMAKNASKQQALLQAGRDALEAPAAEPSGGLDAACLAGRGRTGDPIATGTPPRISDVDPRRIGRLDRADEPALLKLYDDLADQGLRRLGRRALARAKRRLDVERAPSRVAPIPYSMAQRCANHWLAASSPRAGYRKVAL